jgi:glycosyltransferase involved in cell wall biosynthesis
MVAVLELIEPAAPPVPKPAGNAALRVLMVLRPDASSRFGGDTVQARSTAAALRDLETHVDIVESVAPDPRGYDIAHVFGISEPDKCGPQIERCKAAGVPVALSPIWIGRAEFFARAPACERILRGSRSAADARRALSRLARRQAHDLTGWRTKVRTERVMSTQAGLLEAADILLPGSANEAREYGLRLAVRDKPFVVVPLGTAFDRVPAWSQTRSGAICAARVESMKNQAMVALALRDEALNVTFVGEIYDYYGDLCKKWASPRVRFADRMTQPELFELFARAEVHCMPSWGETAGMAAFEAAACGAKIVAGDRGSEMEYLGEDAEYADPADPESILAAVRRSLRRPPRATGDALDRRLHELTWRRAAEKTLEGYRIALGVPLA